MDSKGQQLMAQEVLGLRTLCSPQATAADLPYEVLTAIFQHACDDTNAFPLVLGGVCAGWRNLVWSTPGFWTSLHVSIIMDEDNGGNEILPSRCYDIVQLYFVNLRGSLLSLELRDMNVWDPRCGSLLRGPFIPYRVFFGLIFQVNPHKLGGFQFQEVSPEWWDILYGSFEPGLLTRLTFIDLEWYSSFQPDISTAPFDILPIPSLTKVTLSDHGAVGLLSFLRFPWDQLTSLELWFCPVDECLELLMNKCPRLKKFRSAHPKDSFKPFSRFKYLDTTVRNLETLDWCFQDNDWTRFLLTSVQFPSLRCLYDREELGYSPDLRQLVDKFIQDSPHLTIFWMTPSRLT